MLNLSSWNLWGRMMKIKRLKIHTFGGIKDKDITFEDGFNYVAHKNEFGKSSIIEAIKAGIYGFSPVKNYPYLPLTGEKIDFEFTLDLAAETNNAAIVNVSRIHSGERVQSKMVYEDSENTNQKAKAIRNKSIYDALNEHYGMDLHELAQDHWMIDSDSIEEHKKFLKTIKKSTISLYESINYKGNSLEDIKKSIDQQKREIYTNSSNSNSKIKKNETQIIKINEHIKELIELERNKQEDYAEYLALNEKKLMIEEELSSLKQTKVTLEKDSEIYKLISDYKKLKIESEVNNYKSIADSPKLAELNKYKEKLNSIEAKIAELQNSLNEEESKHFDNSLKNLVLLDQDDELREVFHSANQLEKLSRELHLKENTLRESSLIDASDIDTKKAHKELLDYSIEFSKMEQFNWINQKALFKNKESIYFSIILITLVLSYFNIYSGIGFVLFSFFVFLFIKNKEKQEKYAFEKIIDINIDKYVELLKLNRGRNLVSTLKKPTEEVMELISKDLATIDEYQKIKIEYESINKNLDEMLMHYNDIDIIIKESRYSILELAELYHREKAGLLLSIKQQESLNSTLLNLTKEKSNIENMIDKIEKTYINLWGFLDESKLEQLFEDAKLNQKQLKLIELELEDSEFCGDIENVKSVDIEAELYKIDENISNQVQGLTNIKETIARLEERLLNKEHITMSEYQGLSVAEIKNVREEIKKENQRLAKIYNQLTLKEKIIERSFEILKTKLKPSYVKSADEYLTVLAPDCKVYIEYSASSEIVFKDKNTAEFLDFKMLSTGTQAQVVLSLKIAYLDNLDPNCMCPIIIDDALMAYDNKRKKETLKLLQELSMNRQIIYFEAV